MVALISSNFSNVLQAPIWVESEMRHETPIEKTGL